GGRVYRLAFAASVTLLALFLAGAWIAWRRGFAIALPLALIAYIPATLAFVLTNMRYSIAVQPLVFMFVATTLVTMWDARPGSRVRAAAEATAAPRRAGTGTAPQP